MIISLLLFLLSCTEKEVFDCSEEVACAFGSICVDGQCQAQTCATSDQCPIEAYCGDDHACVSGCQVDTDCMFGDVCNVEAGTCEQQQCSSTRTDCAFGEFCSPSGECYEAAGYYCHECEDDNDCGGNGNYCLTGGYCGVTCESDSDCPNGYDCSPLQDNSGNIVAYQCFTYCWLYEE